MNFKIFPCGKAATGEKFPLINGWATKASSDPLQIKTWQDQYRDRIAGWGLPTGSINNLWVLDIDVKGEKNGFEYLNRKGIQLPTTMYQRTPSGGAHLFFKNNPSLNLRNTVNKDLGIDSRGEGGFVWIYNISNDPPIDIPNWALEIVQKPVNHIDPNQTNTYSIEPTIALERFNTSINAIRNAGQGERNNILNTHSYIIGQLVSANAVPAQYAWDEVTKAALSIGLTPHEIQATTQSGFKGGASHPLTHPFGDTPPVPVIPIIPDMPMVEEQIRWTPTFATREELMDWTKLKKPQLFKDWSTEDIHLTSAIGGVGKTTLKLYEAVCLALGQPFLGFECIQPGRTLFVIGEDSEPKLKAMLGRICQQLGILELGQEHRLNAVLNNVVIKLADELPLVTFNRGTNTYVTNQDSVAKIKQAIEDLNPKQIIFDPIGMFSGPESGGNDAAVALSKTMNLLQRISGASIDMISHIGKDSATKKDVGQFSARGATALANHSRVIRTLLKLNSDEYVETMGEVLPDGQTAIQCFVSKFSDGSPLLDNPFMIIRDGYTFYRKQIPQSTGQGNFKTEKDRVMNFVRANSSESKPVTEKHVCDHFHLQNPKINKSTCKAVISMLQLEGALIIEEHLDQITGAWLRPA